MAIADLAPPPTILMPQEIVRLAEKRMRGMIGRDAIYDTLALYYFGQQPSDSTVQVLAANSQGRPLLRDLERWKGNAQIYSAQRLAPIVDDYQALIGRMPNSRAEPPDSSDAGEAHAELLTKFLISAQTVSDMDRQQIDAGFHLPGLGDACYVIEVDPDLHRATWSVVNPRTAYPRFLRGHRRFQVADLVIRTIEDPDVIYADYGFMPKTDSPADCAVTIYISPNQRSVVVGTQEHLIKQVHHIEWDLGFCPAQWVYNKINGRYAQSDIAQSLAQQDFLDFAYNILIDGLVRNVYGTIISVVNPQNMDQQQIQLGPNPPPVMLQDGGSIQATQIGGNPQPALSMISQTIDDINTSSGTSQVRQEGQMQGSIQTGRAIHAAQGPQSTRVDLKYQNLGAAFEMLNAMTIETQLKAPYLGNRRFEIFGRFKGKSFFEEIGPEDLKWNGKIFTRNTVTWDSMMGLNLQQKEQIATQGMVAGLWDDLHARELVGVDDPIGMRDRIKAYEISRGQTQAEVQQISGAPPAPGGAAPPMPGQKPQGRQPAPMLMAPNAGAPVQPQPSPPVPPQPSPQGQGLPTGVPQGVSRKAIQTALDAIGDKLKGDVFAIGDLATTGQSMKPQLVVADWKDYSLVLSTLKPIAPNIQIRALGDKPPPPMAVKVA